MTLFVSDLHHDYAPDPADPLAASSREDERALLACLQHHRRELKEVVLLGDLFDAYVEYRDLVPKGLTRLLGLLASWSDEGLGITVCVGNHDPWHRSWFEDDLGFTLYRESGIVNLDGHRVHVGHGDREERGGRSPGSRIARHPAALRLYTTLLPGDTGQRLARWTSRRFRSRDMDPQTHAALRSAAERILARGDADLVVLGHGHLPELRRGEDGVYLNPGAWPLSRSYALVDRGTCRLLKWTAEGPEQVDEAPVARTRPA